jgi:hypothetical protein
VTGGNLYKVTCAPCTGLPLPASYFWSRFGGGSFEKFRFSIIFRCRTHSEIQRQNIAKIMCNLLEYLPSQDFKNTTGLNGALQQMVMKFILEDEHITVRFTDVIDSTATGEIFEGMLFIQEALILNERGEFRRGRTFKNSKNLKAEGPIEASYRKKFFQNFSTNVKKCLKR